MPRKSKKIKLYKDGIARKEQLIRSLDLPEEVMLNLPITYLYGNKKIEIHHFKGLVEYQTERIRINTSIGVLVIEGKNLRIKIMTAEELHIIGNIEQVLYAG